MKKLLTLILVLALCLNLSACQRTITSALPSSGDEDDFDLYLDISYTVTAFHKNPSDTYEVHGQVAPIVVVKITAEVDDLMKENVEITAAAFYFELKSDVYESKSRDYTILTRMSDGTYSGSIALVMNPLIKRTHVKGEDFSEYVDGYEISRFAGTYTTG